jgi:hypothetical protein
MLEPMVNMLIPAIIKIEPNKNITITPGKIGAREIVRTKTIAQIGKTDESDSLSEPKSNLIKFPLNKNLRFFTLRNIITDKGIKSN